MTPNLTLKIATLQGSSWASQVALVVKNPPANAGDPRDVSSISGLGRSPRVGNRILAWKIP